MSSGPCGSKHARTQFAYLHDHHHAIKNVKTPRVFSVSVANSYALLHIIFFFFVEVSMRWTIEGRSNNERNLKWKHKSFLLNIRRY